MTTLPPPPPKPSAPAAAAKAPPATKWKRVDNSPPTGLFVLNCQEGWGKTSMMAHAPKPLMILSPQESGYITLRKADRVPDLPYAEPTTFAEFKKLLADPSLAEFDTVCIDTLSGFWGLLTDEVLGQDFDGNPMKYANYGKGDKASTQKWATLSPLLEALKQKVNVIAATHSAVESFDAPEGEAYKRYASRIYKDAWGETKRISDAVLFGTFFTTVDESGKGKGGTQRVLHTEHRASHDAKNRYGLDPIIQMGGDPSKTYAELFSKINKGTK